MKIIVVKIQKWLPRYLLELKSSILADMGKMEFGSTGEMTLAVARYIEDYRRRMTLEKVHRYGAMNDYGARIRYMVTADEVLILNITGRCKMLSIRFDRRND